MAKRVLFILLACYLVLCPGQRTSFASVVLDPPAATESHGFVRLAIPDAQVWASIQVIRQLPDGSWEEPNHVSVWVLEPYPQAFYMHRDGLGLFLDQLRPGSKAFLYEDWLMETEPLPLRVFRLEVIGWSEENNKVLSRIGGDTFVLITCHPAKDPTAPQRLVVWAVADYQARN